MRKHGYQGGPVVVGGPHILLSGTHGVILRQARISPGLGEFRHGDPLLLPAFRISFLDACRRNKGLADLASSVSGGSQNKGQGKFHFVVLEVHPSMGFMGVPPLFFRNFFRPQGSPGKREDSHGCHGT